MTFQGTIWAKFQKLPLGSSRLVSFLNSHFPRLEIKRISDCEFQYLCVFFCLLLVSFISLSCFGPLFKLFSNIGNIWRRVSFSLSCTFFGNSFFPLQYNTCCSPSVSSSLSVTKIQTFTLEPLKLHSMSSLFSHSHTYTHKLTSREGETRELLRNTKRLFGSQVLGIRKGCRVHLNQQACRNCPRKK